MYPTVQLFVSPVYQKPEDCDVSVCIVLYINIYSRTPLLWPPLELTICGRYTGTGTCGHSQTHLHLIKVVHMVALNMDTNYMYI